MISYRQMIVIIFNQYAQSLPVAAPVTIAIKSVTTKPSIWNPAWSATDLSSSTSGNNTEKLSKNLWNWNSMVRIDNKHRDEKK